MCTPDAWNYSKVNTSPPMANMYQYLHHDDYRNVWIWYRVEGLAEWRGLLMVNLCMPRIHPKHQNEKHQKPSLKKKGILNLLKEKAGKKMAVF